MYKKVNMLSSSEFNEKNARFYCKVYFAKSFEKLREMVIPSGEDRYIRQLSRTVVHRPKGGKTRAEFYRTVGKTQDDFIKAILQLPAHC